MPKPFFHSWTNQIKAEIIRVDHAGEYSACHILSAQRAANRALDFEPILKEMHEAEKEHLRYFEAAVLSHRIRPTIFLGCWHIISRVLGSSTAALGPKKMMLCTEAIEAVIGRHYAKQIEQLTGVMDQQQLRKKLEQFMAEELEHHDTAQEHTHQLNITDYLLKHFIMNICKIAITLSRKF